MVTNLLIINGALYLANMLFGQPDNWITEWSMVSPDVLVKPWLWWKLITNGFAHSPFGLSHIFFNMFGLWIFGRDVENIYGRKEFLKFYLSAIVLGSLVWVLTHYVRFGSGQDFRLLGASGAVTAVTMLFILHFPKRTILLMMVLPVPAWVMGMLIIFGNLFGSRLPGPGGHQIAYDVHLVGAAFAICYFQFGWNLGHLVPEIRSGPSFKNSLRRMQARPTLRVHSPEADDNRQMNVEADHVLDKLHQQGEESLTARERRVLEDYSRRMRKKHQ